MANAYKLTEEIVAHVETLTAIGVPIEEMAPALGVSDVSIYNWKKRGEQLFEKNKKPKNEHDRLCMELFKARKKGVLRFITTNLNYIKQATPKNWQAAAWLLERRFPTHFGKEKIEDGRERSEANKVDLGKLDGLSNEELRRKYDAHKLQHWS